MENNLVNKQFLLLFILTVCCLISSISCSSDVSKTGNTNSLIDSIEVDEYELNISFENGFTSLKRDTIRHWIHEVFQATEKTLGDYQFDVYVEVILSSSRNSPVPFGMTSRKKGLNQVKLYVNPEATYEELMEDWTTPHEFSHLAVPFTGRKNKWFSEGFATYCSRRTLMTMGYLTEEEFEKMYTEEIEDVIHFYNATDRSFALIGDSLFNNHHYGPVYWGGTSFFMILDSRLQSEKNWRLTTVIQKYQQNGRLEDQSLRDVIQSFDHIIGEDWCKDLLSIYLHQPGAEAVNRYYER